MSVTIPFIPAHKKDFISIMETVLFHYYEKAFGKLKRVVSEEALASNVNSSVDKPEQHKEAMSYQWSSELQLIELFYQNPFFMTWKEKESKSHQHLLFQEILIQIRLKKDRSLHRNELILEQRKIQAIAQLHHSVVSTLSNSVKEIQFFFTKNLSNS
jgi:exocyst complex component 4